MQVVLDVLSWAAILVGGGFCLIGGLGMIRLPDMFARMHAAGIVDTVGLGFLMIGMAFQAGLTIVTIKLALIVLFILYTSPVSTHALAQAALSSGEKPVLADDASAMAQEKEPEPSKP